MITPRRGGPPLILVSLFLAFWVLLAAQPAHGRAGGGQSYSSGSEGSDSSSHSSSSDGSSGSGGSTDSGGSGDGAGMEVFFTILECFFPGGSSDSTYPTGRANSEAPLLKPPPLSLYFPDLEESSTKKMEGESIGNVGPFLVALLVLAFLDWALLSPIIRRPPQQPATGREPPPIRYKDLLGGRPSGKPSTGPSEAESRGPAPAVPLEQEASKGLVRFADDPGFAEGAFLERCRKAFAATQEAWSAMDLQTAQAFLSDGVFERFSLQLSDLRRDRIRDVMKDVKILGAETVQFGSDANYDTISIRMTATAVNYRADIDSGKRLEGPEEPQEFAEVWSFIRRLGAKTSKKPGLIEGACPNCSAPLEASRIAVCKACNSFIRSGEYDWVLAEITQTCEWSSRPAREIPGRRAYLALDPGFNIQHVEDRTSLIFWRRMECHLTGTTTPLLKCASPEFVATMEKKIAPDSAGVRKSFAGIAVGAVDVTAVVAEEPMDQIFVEVRWSAAPVTIDAAGRKNGQGGKAVNSHDIFVLKRKHGAVTDTRLSLSSSHCPGCGAPEAGPTESVCPYCGTAFNDGAREWVLDCLTGPLNDAYLGVCDRLAKADRIKDHRA